MNENAKIVASALAGLAIGVIVGVFFAPEKGSVTRNRLNNGFRRSPNIQDPEEMSYHPEFENEGARNARLKRPAREKLKETRDKITANGTHAESNISGQQT